MPHNFSSKALSFFFIFSIMLGAASHALAGRHIRSKHEQDKKQPEWFLQPDGTVIIPGVGRLLVPMPGGTYVPGGDTSYVPGGGTSSPSGGTPYVPGGDTSPPSGGTSYVPGGDDTFVPNPGYEVPNPNP